MLRRLEELGLPPEAVLRQAGLPMGLLREEKILVSTEEFFALYRGIAEANDDPGFGLKLGTEGRVERYDPIKLAGSQGARYAAFAPVVSPANAFARPNPSCART